MALRYLRGAEGRTEGRAFLRFITYVAIGGVALGVAALLLSLFIVRGFSQEIQNKIIGFGAHVQVHSYLQDAPLRDASSVSQRLASLPGVAAVTPNVEDFVLLRRSSDALDGAVVRGVPSPPSYLRDRIIDGAFQLAPSADGDASLVVGGALARRLGIEVGQTVTLFSMRSDDGGSAMSIQRPRVRSAVVRGIYETSLTTIDDLYVFTDLSTARRLTATPSNAVHHFDLRVRDVSRVDSLAAKIEDDFGFPIAARTIYQQYAGLFAWVNLQEGIVPLVIGVIVLVAAFNIIGALLMLILEKTREVGVLQSLGASPHMMRRLFLNVGLLIGGVGTTIGMGLALTLGWLQKTFHIIPLPAEAYYMTTAPVELNPIDFVVVGVVTIALCGLAAYVPARVAAHIDPVRAIRFE